MAGWRGEGGHLCITLAEWMYFNPRRIYRGRQRQTHASPLDTGHWHNCSWEASLNLAIHR